jgi:hypothetical protein
MRLANKAVVAALLTLMLCVFVSAQTLRKADDPRNQAPTIGTGGPPGGMTGLFTIADAQTLRRGEYTFSAAYSNYDRDPGDVDITEVPLSFQIGLNNRLELFFNTDAYRGIKVNSPANLSGFYLPNSQLLISGVLRSPAAIILSPRGTATTGSINLIAIFRPEGNQPFVQFPFQGGSAGTFGLLPGNPNGIGPLFGFPAGLPQLGIFRTGGAADLFPGVGSPFGGILPGVVWATAQLICPAGIPFPPARPCGFAPVSFSVAPTYLPDAPFLNRRYGQTAFNTFTVGAKIRLNNEESPWGIALIPFYRFYADKANDFSGFNQLQRGASPGGNAGDFGIIAAFDARLAKNANLSANIGYIWNSNPKGQFPGGEFTMLDRPPELQSGLALDFPVNKYFQIIGEMRSTIYVGGRTPNALENDPVDILGGFRIFPRRWFGFSAGYRLHVNQQDRDSFDGGQNTTITINGAGPNGTTATFNQIVGGVPVNMRTSDDPHGFFFQFWAGRRNNRAEPPPPNRAPTVNLTSPDKVVVVNCPEGQKPAADCPAPGAGASITLNANASDPDGDQLLYSYNVSGGRINGTGGSVSWDLSGASPGTYSVTVQVDDGHGCVTTQSKDITVEACGCDPDKPPCADVSVSSASTVQEPTPTTFTARISDPTMNVTYNWTVSAGRIIEGQGTPNITVDTANLGGQTVTATVQVGGMAPECPSTKSASTEVEKKPGPPPGRAVVEEQVARAFNDDKAQLDNFATELQADPTSTGVFVVFAGSTSKNKQEADIRANRAIDYLVNSRGISRDRLRAVIVEDGTRPKLSFQGWLVPAGGDASAIPTGREPRPTGRRR